MWRETDEGVGVGCEAEEKLRLEQHREHLAKQLSQHSLVVQAQEIVDQLRADEDHGDRSHVGLTGLASIEESLGEAGGSQNWSHVGPMLESSREGCSDEAPFHDAHANHDDGCSSGVGSHHLVEQALGHLRFNPDNRLPTAAQRKALLRRDRYRCQTPGCPHHRWLHLHHVTWHSRQGATVADNLVTLCTACHKKVHDGQLHVSGTPQTGLVFTDARGQRLDRVHRLETAAWLDYWLGWSGEEHDRYQGRVAV